MNDYRDLTIRDWARLIAVFALAYAAVFFVAAL